MFVFGAVVLSCSVNEIGISIPSPSTEHCSIHSSSLQEISAMNAPNAVSGPDMMASLSSSDADAGVATDHAQAATTTDNGTVCANCGNPAKRRCLGCISDFDERGNADEPPTCYCDKICRKKHWKTHKPQCQLAVDRRQLFRIGRLVQWAFYKSVRTMWYDRILEVKRTRDTGALDGAQLELWRCKKHDLSDFPKFSEGSFSNVYGEKLEEYDKQAVLATSACTGTSICALVWPLVNGKSQSCLIVSQDLH